jgi:hypothetical protein
VAVVFRLGGLTAASDFAVAAIEAVNRYAPVFVTKAFAE